MKFPQDRPCKILVCGDSISAGVVYDKDRLKYVKTGNNFVKCVQNRFNVAVTNISRFGNTVLTAMPRLERSLERQRPDALFIELGGNDCDFNWDDVANTPDEDHLPATQLNVFEEKLGQIIDMVSKNGIKPIIATLPPLDAERYFKWISKGSEKASACILKWLGSVSKIYWWHERYNASIMRIVERKGISFIDFRSVFLKVPDYREYICEDGIHPNERGQILMFSAISDYVGSHFPNLKLPDDLHHEGEPAT